MVARDDPHFRLRITEKVKAAVQEAAERSRRSMTAEINFQLERAYGLLREAAGDRIAAPDPAASRNAAARQGGEVVNHG